MCILGGSVYKISSAYEANAEIVSWRHVCILLLLLLLLLSRLKIQGLIGPTSWNA